MNRVQSWRTGALWLLYTDLENVRINYGGGGALAIVVLLEVSTLMAIELFFPPNVELSPIH